MGLGVSPGEQDLSPHVTRTEGKGLSDIGSKARLPELPKFGKGTRPRLYG